MKSPGIIYRRYRQLKKKFLYEKIVEAKLKKHPNCFYGKAIEYTDINGNYREVRLCLLEPRRDNFEDISICTCPMECNAFLNKRSKESVLEEFESTLRDNRLKAEVYPELEIIEWVLDKDKSDAIKSPNLIGKIVLKLMDVLEYILGTFGKDRKNSMKQASINN